MCSLCRLRRLLAVLGLVVAACADAGPPMSLALEPPPPAHVDIPKGVLRVCADPNNMPFSNRAGQGFENAIARIVDHELKRSVEYTWWPQRRGFVRQTLRAGLCDVVIGVPSRYALTANTRPYYRSTYVFVSRRHGAVASFDDPRLRAMRVGVTVIGDDYANTPPVQALAARGMAANIRGYSIYGDYSQPDPPRDVIDAVARGDVDVAIVWGPLAGYFAPKEPVPLALTPVSPNDESPELRMSYAIAVGVRGGDLAWRDEVDRALTRRQRDIARVLARFGVPTLPLAAEAGG